jgi:TonB family protein
MGRVVQQPQNDYVVKRIMIAGLSDAATQQLRSQLPVREGDTLTPEKYSELRDTVHAFDSHLIVHSLAESSTETAIAISLNPAVTQTLATTPRVQVQSATEDIHISGEIQKANVVTQTPIVYPPLAKAARVQGTVTFIANIGTDGTVQNLQLMSGPPLLVQAAMQSVNQWVYKPTLLNGKPVPVITTIEVNFTLAE